MSGMNDWIRQKAGRGPGRGAELSTAGVSDEQAQFLARELGLMLSEARGKLEAAAAGPPPVPAGNAGAGTGAAPPAGAMDMNTAIRNAANGTRRGRFG